MRRERWAAWVLLALLLGLALGCSRGPEADPALPDLAAAMAGERPVKFHPRQDIPREITVPEIPAAMSPGSDYAALWRFAVLDLDGDGQSEAVLQVIDAAGDMGGFVVLHWYRGEVRGYCAGCRYFEELKADGSFFFRVEEVGWGVGRMELNASDTGGGYSVAHGLWSEPFPQPERWRLGETPVSQAVFDQGVENQRKKPDAVWYDYTPEGVALAFPS